MDILRRILTFWHLLPSCSEMQLNRRFGGTCLHIQGWRVSQVRCQMKTYTAAGFMLVSWLTYFSILGKQGELFLRNVGQLSTDYTTMYPRRYKSSLSPLWKPKILHSVTVSETKHEAVLAMKCKRITHCGLGICSKRKAVRKRRLQANRMFYNANGNSFLPTIIRFCQNHKLPFERSNSIGAVSLLVSFGVREVWTCLQSLRHS